MATCTGTTKAGAPCTKSAVKDTDPPRCRTHGEDDGSVHPKKAAFLAAFSLTGVVITGCQAAEVSRTTYYRWLDDDPEFAAAIPLAKEHAIDVLVAEAVKRATVGGSDTMLIFLLKAADPARFRDRYTVEHSGTVNHDTLDDARMAAAADELAARRERKPG